MSAKPTKRVKGSVGEGETSKKAKATHHAGGESVSEKSQATRTNTSLHCGNTRVTHTHTHPDIHTLTIVSRTHTFHIDRGLYTYMTSYLPQAYRLSILIDKSTLFINSWLIRL